MTTLSAEAYQAWVAEGCKGDLDAWAGIWAARQEQAQKRRPRRERPTGPFPKSWATREAGPGGLHEEIEAFLNGLQRAGKIEDWAHIPSGPWSKGMRAGLPDFFIGVRDGVHGEIEAKSATGVVSYYQARWLRWFGREATVCRSLDEVKAFLRTLGVEV